MAGHTFLFHAANRLRGHKEHVNRNSAIQMYVEYFDVFVKFWACDQGFHPTSSVLVKAWQKEP